jgi:hypothetical protein
VLRPRLKRGLGFNHGEAQPRKVVEERIQPVLHGFSHITIFYITGYGDRAIAAPCVWKHSKGLCYTGFIMKVLILYRPNSEHGRLIEEFVHEYQQRHQSDRLEVLSIDTREGSATATLYDIMQYPAILVVQTDGYVQKVWQGESLPMMDEVASYAQV